jgi:hypothetical protein
MDIDVQDLLTRNGSQRRLGAKCGNQPASVRREWGVYHKWTYQTVATPCSRLVRTAQLGRVDQDSNTTQATIVIRENLLA